MSSYTRSIEDELVETTVNESRVIETRALAKRYDSTTGSVQALADVELDIRDGEFVSIVGASGCGKSTLLRILAGLDPFDSGTVVVDGKPVVKPDASRAVVFQHYGLLPWRTVQANVELALAIQRRRKHERAERARQAIARVGLAGFEHHYPSQLSGGMQQRVGLARALTKSPRVLLMDEPFAAVDLQTRERLQEELLRVWREIRCAVVFITHGIDEAVFLADRVLVMRPRPGRVIGAVDVAIPRPRNGDDVRSSAEFARLCNEVRRLLHYSVPEEETT